MDNEKNEKYAFLSRLQSDCEYFLGNGRGYEGHLYYGSVDRQCDEMENSGTHLAKIKNLNG